MFIFSQDRKWLVNMDDLTGIAVDTDYHCLEAVTKKNGVIILAGSEGSDTFRNNCLSELIANYMKNKKIYVIPTIKED